MKINVILSNNDISSPNENVSGPCLLINVCYSLLSMGLLNFSLSYLFSIFFQSFNTKMMSFILAFKSAPLKTKNISTHFPMSCLLSNTSFWSF